LLALFFPFHHRNRGLIYLTSFFFFSLFNGRLPAVLFSLPFYFRGMPIGGTRLPSPLVKNSPLEQTPFPPPLSFQVFVFAISLVFMSFFAPTRRRFDFHSYPEMGCNHPPPLHSPDCKASGPVVFLPPPFEATNTPFVFDSVDSLLFNSIMNLAPFFTPNYLVR